jgi:hypothetical protein
MADPTVILDARPSNAPGLELQHHLLAELATPENIPSGILHRCAPHISRIRDFSGSASSPLSTQAEWEDLYHELAFSRMYGVELLRVSEVKARGASYVARGLTPIFVADFNYEIVRPRFWTAAQRYVSAQLQVEQFPLDSHPIGQILESRRAFFATAVVKTDYGLLTTLPRVHRGLDVSFVVPRDGFFSNHAVELGGIEVDFGRGTGFQQVQLGAPVKVPYSEPGLKTIQLRCSTSVGVAYARFGLEVALPVAPPADAYWDLTAYEAYQGTKATGHAWVYYGSVNGVKKSSITAPVIVAEGFPGNYPLDYLWDRLNQQGLASSMLAEGRDLIILGFTDGTLAIQANAFVTVSCIQRAIKERLGTTPLQVGGASMGGLVTRYALTFMEKNNLPHQTSRYFTIDSPHGGATISPSVQAFVQYISVYQASAAPFAAMLASPAAQQMLMLWIPPYKNWNSSGMPIGQSPMREQFLSDLRTQGWMPRNVLSAAVADGVGTGVQNGDTPGAEAVGFTATACIWDQSYVFPLGGSQVTFAKMECNKVDALVWTFWSNNGPGYDSAPGGLTDGFAQLYATLPNSKWINYSNACFIPTVSACATNNGFFQPISQNTPSDFNYFKFSTKGNLSHIELSAELAVFIAGFIRGDSELSIERGEMHREDARRRINVAAAATTDGADSEAPGGIGQRMPSMQHGETAGGNSGTATTQH